MDKLKYNVSYKSSAGFATTNPFIHAGSLVLVGNNSMITELDSKFYLGVLCPYNHRWDTSVFTLRYKSNKKCLECCKLRSYEKQDVGQKKLRRGGIYAITCLANKKVYIGSSLDYQDRWSRHKRMLCSGNHDNIHLQRAWNLYGEGVFVFTVIEHEINPKKLIETEQRWIDLFDSANPQKGFNIAPKAGSRLGSKHTDEAKGKISESLKGRKISSDTIQKRRETLKKRGIKPSKECLQKAAEAKRGKPPSQLTIQRLRERTLGIKQSPEHLEKRIALIRKSYILTSPLGEKYFVDNLPAFCKKNNLQGSKLCLVAQGKRRHHKGWRCEYVK